MADEDQQLQALFGNDSESEKSKNNASGKDKIGDEGPTQEEQLHELFGSDDDYDERHAEDDWRRDQAR